jgi:hypothetical protein
MAYRIGLTLGREVVRGRAMSLTLPLVDDAGNAQTAAAGATLSVWLGSTLLLDEVEVVEGPPASYALTALEVPATLALSAEWLEVWTTSLGVFTVSGWLVRRGYASRVTDSTLQQVHPEILHLLPPGETTAEKFRVKASEKIQRELLNKGRRPWLVFEVTALLDAEVYLALHYWAQDAAMRTSGTSTYATLAREFWAAFEREWARVSFNYDADEDGLIDEADKQTAEPSGILLTQGRSRSRGWAAYR